MKPFAFSIAVYILGVVVNPVQAQGRIEWADKYPKTTPVNKQILIKGRITLDKGWKIVGNSVLVSAWEDGCMVDEIVVKLNKDEKSWGETKLALPPGAEYNIYVQVRVTEGKSWKRLTSEPKRVKTK